jgi:hypothetical protein
MVRLVLRFELNVFGLGIVSRHEDGEFRFLFTLLVLC